MPKLPDGLIAFGSHANCTLDLCPIEASILQYQPSIPGNAVIAALFGVSMLIHLVQGLKWRQWSFMICLIVGCLDQIIGYVGRILLSKNPFSFNAFIIQIVCITTAPVFFCAAIYVLLVRTINHLDPSISRFPSKLFAWVFIPFDIVSLILQALGGALSATQASSGNKSGVNISMGGLILQVITLGIFVILFADYVVRYIRHPLRPVGSRLKLFLAFLFLAIILVLVRCAYRIEELSDGYDGPLIRDEALFVGLESVMMVLAVFCLNIAHPGFVFGREPARSAGIGYSATPASEQVMQQKDFSYSSSG
ncbi:RTA1 like protein-domain-containing protein [Dichotomopilus funicola]|uniref:RTA1 like protein-domain-containing protein n=1 Tax=Dichotomopilus funicola TaxID=1934379 RepID=A0AAN6ZQ63_9PEZI|nr:RTA1 like protein-domain-containing protein [Dichotomopilus funicola]